MRGECCGVCVLGRRTIDIVFPIECAAKSMVFLELMEPRRASSALIANRTRLRDESGCFFPIALFLRGALTFSQSNCVRIPLVSLLFQIHLIPPPWRLDGITLSGNRYSKIIAYTGNKSILKRARGRREARNMAALSFLHVGYNVRAVGFLRLVLHGKRALTKKRVLCAAHPLAGGIAGEYPCVSTRPCVDCHKILRRDRREFIRGCL